MTTTHDVGFVGIGNMGVPMVRCLAKAGLTVAIYDVRADSMAPFEAAAPAVLVCRDVSREVRVCHSAACGGHGRRASVRVRSPRTSVGSRRPSPAALSVGQSFAVSRAIYAVYM